MKSILSGLAITFVLMVVLMTCQSCSSGKAARKLKRAEKLITQAETLGAKWHEESDTVIKFVDVKVPEIKVDTVFSVSNDTIRFIKDSIQYKILIRDKKVYFHVQSKPKYFRVKQTVVVNKTKTISAGYTVWDIIKWCIMTAVVSILLTRLLWRK